MTDTHYSATKDSPDWPGALALGALLALVYLVTFSGQIRSIDEYAMYARAEAIAQGYQDGLSQLAFSVSHNQVGEFEPVQPYLAVPLYSLSQRIAGSSSIAAVMLLNVFVTAATGSLLYILFRGLDLRPNVSVLAVFAWGLGSSAWPYSRSFFREPLNALLWVAAITLCVYWWRSRNVLYVVACATTLAVCVAVKSSSAVATPWFVVASIVGLVKTRSARKWWGLVCIFVLVCVGFLLFPRVDLGLLPRRLTGAIHLLRTFDWARLPLQLYGELFSPMKGLLFYSPMAVGSLAGVRGFVRNHRRVALLSFAIAVSVLALYSTFLAWHGGRISWGPRYFVPILPLMALPFAHALSSRRRLPRAWAVLWGGVGVVVQLAASTTAWTHAVWPSINAYVGERLVGLDGIPWYSLRLFPRSPVVEVISGWSRARLDLAWARALVDGGLSLSPRTGVVLLTLAACAGIGLVAVLRNSVRSRYLAIGSCALVVLGSLLVSMRSGVATEDTWGLSRAQAQEAAAAINSTADISYDLVFVSNDFAMHYWLGLLKGRYTITWVSPLSTAAEYSQIATGLRGESVWLFIDHVHMPLESDPNAPRQIMSQALYEVEGQWVGDHELLRYAKPQGMSQTVTAIHWDDGVVLRKLALSSNQVSPEEALLLDLEFSVERKVYRDLTLYVNLVSRDGGDTVSGRDGQPQYGGAPTSGWTPMEPVLVRRAILIPAQVEPGMYDVVCGWYDSDGRESRVDQGPLRHDDKAALCGSVEVLP